MVQKKDCLLSNGFVGSLFLNRSFSCLWEVLLSCFSANFSSAWEPSDLSQNLNQRLPLSTSSIRFSACIPLKKYWANKIADMSPEQIEKLKVQVLLKPKLEELERRFPGSNTIPKARDSIYDEVEEE